MSKNLGLKELIINICCSIFSLLLCFASFELLLRAGIIPTRFYKIVKPDGENTDPKFKILILGDSFFTRHASIYRLLVNDLKPYKISLLNGSESGNGPFEYLTSMKVLSAKFKPDVVLLSYYVGNDLSDVQYNNQYSDSLIQKTTNLFRPFSRGLYAYHFFKEKEHILLPHHFDYKKMGKYFPAEIIERAKKSEINIWLLEKSMENTNYYLDNLLMNSDKNMNAWQKVKDILSEINTISNRIDSKLIIVIFPATLQVNKSHFEFVKRLNFKTDERTLSLDKPQTHLIEFCRKSRIECLDLLPYFRAHKDKEFYLEDDDHLNELGNLSSEKIVLDFIKKNLQLENKKLQAVR